MKTAAKNIYLIDGHALCYRAFYAIKELRNSKGMPTNAIYGFINILSKIIKEFSPDMLVVAFDSKGKTQRHKMYSDYKIHRKPMPDDLVVQIPRIREVVEALKIPVCQEQGYEADDIIATLAAKAKKKGFLVTIVTSDKDALQLVDDEVKVLNPHDINREKIKGHQQIVDKYGVAPDKMLELMALMGDASDNIPGVKGIGQVAGSKLISTYGTVSKVYENLEDIHSESLKKKLTEGKEMASLSRSLIELDKKVPVKVNFKKTVLTDPDVEKLAKLYKEFEFTKLLQKIAPEEKKKIKYDTEMSPQMIEKSIKDMRKAGCTALNVAKNDREKVKGVSFSWKEKQGCFVPLNDDNFKYLKEILESKTICKIGYDMKDDLMDLVVENIHLKALKFDVMIGDYLIDPSRAKHGLEDIAIRYLGYGPAGQKENISWDKDGQGSLDLADTSKEDFSYACERSDIVLRLYKRMVPDIKKKKLDMLFDEVEMPLVNVLADMESEGVSVDIEYLKKSSQKMEKKLNEISQQIYKLAGEEFNINSPKQLQVVLYDNLGLPVLKKTKTGRSTDESVLAKLALQHELPAILLEYRSLNKLKTAYYDSMIELVDKSQKKIHTHFNQAVTATGRLSSSEPNLQNIPIRTKTGREVRKAFISGDKKSILLAADYSQVELRVLAHLSQDDTLLRAFKDDKDIHNITASLIFDCAIDEVTSEMRSAAKTVNFGIVYGISAFGLAKDLDMSVNDAQQFIDAYFKRYKGVKKFIDDTIKKTRKDGYVSTILNRRRYVPEITNANENIKSFAERVAVNTPVQGSAADLIKLAMLKCHDEFKGTSIKMIIQVHDELVFKVPIEDKSFAIKEVKHIMENVFDLDVPLKVDVEVGENWYDMQEVDVS